ncbi:hypothetical protein A3H10_05145 [Candidatus Uhrbacteria bacterium RIFCSPLOWO2_12_FULL_46_10]|uniref:Aspartate/glutamate/uridylate kinase domain-containing protein n=1 Tax=Candidatus Uhrbacteria bacterium RIFCSPLOWO2_01_FULL_47_25 TaxID=1802402 RepID=A0A1F7UT28_9BACT|nr:MAG: hypothetical protein UX68_C0016G0012 [Parcubacteria group bacterium GW2011_GWA2_46_9]OGL68308.1 MAG: hypothetical protein A3D60_05405 [Candidatus Uhrbacteria bacterium RIFCSPHIGHO2_02_FULL_47_29]OGL75219.1 MAG: hypothetical protein A3E96_03115 [Candidatus Uhrbacteria bacterium RIFCSPHIGHO2_12_FULL_46_13]OGL81463.1 MAG: hypothetical protein A2936_00065 [Candidatus Uhrbacteria bacterium RIFCSPLOWO2_01_FULL_47_25]OGL85132.1 MAG: hypothetical protein A3I37_04865 [Candidatus Uhrbacteria bact
MSWTIISLGGAIIVPDDIDVRFLRKFRALIKSFKDRRFVIICGGGGTNRRYNAAALALGRPTNDDLDWIGIRALKLNAELVRTMFGKAAYQKVVDHPNELKRPPKEKIIVAAAFAPGRSSDYDAVLWAKRFRSKKIINLSNVPHVYTADPKKNKSARPVKEMRWSDYRKIVGTKWLPRLSTPFDPIASTLAAKLKLTVLVLDGRNLKNVRRAILGRRFIGSIIHS